MDIRVLDASDDVVIAQLSARAFPSVLLQGDTAYTMLQSLRLARDAADNKQAKDELTLVIDQLEHIIEVYKYVLDSMGMRYPW